MAHHHPSYKLLFSQREMVADLIRGFVREDDIVWRLRLTEAGETRWLYLYLLLEFQSTVDAMLAVRLMTCVGPLYQDLHKAGQLGPGDPLPPVPAIVLCAAPSWFGSNGCCCRPGSPGSRYRTSSNCRRCETCLPNG